MGAKGELVWCASFDRRKMTFCGAPEIRAHERGEGRAKCQLAYVCVCLFAHSILGCAQIAKPEHEHLFQR